MESLNIPTGEEPYQEEMDANTGMLAFESTCAQNKHCPTF